MDYKVQILAALIEDEGRIQPKSASTLIAMQDLDLIEGTSRLIDDLRYERSRITNGMIKGTYSDEPKMMYNVFLLVLGAHKFHLDLSKSVKKYGDLAGLWKKKKMSWGPSPL